MFSQLLETLISARFKSRRAFIRASESGETTDKTRENSAQAYLAKVINGERPPPLDSVSLWLEVLKIPESERQYLLDLAAIAWLPPEVQSRFVDLLNQLETRKLAYGDILQRLERLERSRQ